MPFTTNSPSIYRVVLVYHHNLWSVGDFITMGLKIYIHLISDVISEEGSRCLDYLNLSYFYRAQRFRGYQQQDSHELLRYLMDNMKMEEVKVSNSYIIGRLTFKKTVVSLCSYRLLQSDFIEDNRWKSLNNFKNKNIL